MNEVFQALKARRQLIHCVGKSQRCLLARMPANGSAVSYSVLRIS